jgi:hypothetical protein
MPVLASMPHGRANCESSGGFAGPLQIVRKADGVGFEPTGKRQFPSRF